MRCPYCGGLNADTAKFCARCGRDIKPPTSMQSSPPSSPSQRSPRPPQWTQTSGQQPSYMPRPPQPGTPGQVSPALRPRSVSPAQSPTKVVTEQRGRKAGVAQSAPPQNVATPPAPIEPPAPFPPRSIQQLQALEVGALAYTVLDESESYGRKKIVRIGYPSCTAWQQVATLYKALKAYRSQQFDTILIYGVSPEKVDKYNYTNGMVQYDQSVRLGSQILNRYQIETENGFSSDAVRIVLTEE